MSIGRRLIDLARAELNSLLDKAARSDDDDGGGGDDDEDYGRRHRAQRDAASMSDDELAAEIERRRQAREEVEAAIRGGRRPPPPRSTPPPRSAPPRRTAAGDDAIRKAYAALEVSPGSDFETVRRSYRRMMRKYHPDLHAGSVDKQRAATDLTQRLTEAYKTLERHLRK
jgi:DnaJ-domain-containing protein 1